MRGAKAKAIRRAVYGEQAQRNPRYGKTDRGCIIREPLRRSYQAAKRRIGELGRAWRSSALFAPVVQRPGAPA